MGGSIAAGSLFASAQSVAMGGGLPAVYSIGAGAFAAAGAYFVSPQDNTGNGATVVRDAKCASECDGNEGSLVARPVGLY
jgi:hypothetical protein